MKRCSRCSRHSEVPRATIPDNSDIPSSQSRRRLLRALYLGRTGMHHIGLAEAAEGEYRDESLAPLKDFPGLMRTRMRQKKRWQLKKCSDCSLFQRWTKLARNMWARSDSAIRAGSVAALRDCRVRPAWSRGHSLPDRSRDTPGIHVKLDRHPGTAQAIRIGHVFFEEEIKTADRNVGWRQARHIRCP